MSRLLIGLEHCSVKFDSLYALRDVSFALHAAQRWVLVGANGAGKSVLLKLLRGDMWPTPDGRERRQFCLSGECHSEPGDDKRLIAYLAPERQDKYLRYEWNLTVTQVVTTGLFGEDIPLTKPNARQQVLVRSMLKRLRLWSLRERRLLTLSYGQRRRALLARLLVAQPPVLLLDEVFNGVDAATRLQLRELLENTRQYLTWVLAAHSAEDIPDSATHMLRLKKGRVVYAGPMDKAQLDSVRRDVLARHKAAQRRIDKEMSTHKGPSTSSLKTAPAFPVFPPSMAVAGRTGRSSVRRAGQTETSEYFQSVRPELVEGLSIQTAPSTLIALKNVDLYRDYRPVLRDVSWTVQHGEHWAITGANGSGKSSLLMLLYGDLHPAHANSNNGGVIQREGMQPGMPISKWKQRVGYVSPELQARHYAAGSVEHIVASGRYASVGLNQKITMADRRAAAPWLKFFGIDSLSERSPRQVSYGQLRLALMARAMVNRPQLLLLDEPFTGLDPDLHAQVMATLQQLTRAGTQIIMAIHDAADRLPAVRHLLHIHQGRALIGVP